MFCITTSRTRLPGYIKVHTQTASLDERECAPVTLIRGAHMCQQGLRSSSLDTNCGPHRHTEGPDAQHTMLRVRRGAEKGQEGQFVLPLWLRNVEGGRVLC